MILVTHKSDQDPLIDSQSRSKLAIQEMGWMLSRGSFDLLVHKKKGIPFKAYIKYRKCNIKLELTYRQWSILNTEYFSPDKHLQIQNTWACEE